MWGAKINRGLKAATAGSVLILFLSAFSSDSSRYIIRTNNSFSTGERLKFRVHIGFLSAGEAIMSINEEIHEINHRPCFQINVFGRTSGIFDLFYTVRDNWGTYLDTASLVPHKFYEDKRENKYRKHEVVEFDHCNDSAIVSRIDKEKPVEYFKTPRQPQDLISGYYYIRTLDYTKIHAGQIITLGAFYDKKVYDFKVKFLGRETVKTKLGKIKALAFAPIMPKNDLFEEGNENIKIWLSDDTNKIPIKIWAKMFVGGVEIDLTEVQNLKAPLTFVEK